MTGVPALALVLALASDPFALGALDFLCDLAFGVFDLAAGFGSSAGNGLGLFLCPLLPERFVLLMEFGTGDLQGALEFRSLLVGGFKGAARDLAGDLRACARAW